MSIRSWIAYILVSIAIDGQSRSVTRQKHEPRTKLADYPQLLNDVGKNGDGECGRAHDGWQELGRLRNRGLY